MVSEPKNEGHSMHNFSKKVKIIKEQLVVVNESLPNITLVWIVLSSLLVSYPQKTLMLGNPNNLSLEVSLEVLLQEE